MADFLLELLSEEIPARMQAKARSDLERLFTAELQASGLKADEIVCYSTPRRLALIAKGLPKQTDAVEEEVKGPPQGAPDQAIDGFCRKNAISRDQLEVRDVKGRATYFAIINTPGKAAVELLSQSITSLIKAFPWPKSQRWGVQSISSESMRWVRPLSGIIALFDDTVIACEIDDVVAGRETVGHRFHHKGAIRIENAADYADKLRDAYVMINHNERQNIIRKGAAKAALDAKLQLVEDEGLVIENAGLTEWPVPLLGGFDAAFLDVPEEVIQLTARSHQKYFICRDKAGKLAPHFVCTANIAAVDGGKAIVAGNKKVLAARLSDAKFFWELDQKTALADHAKKLENIVFHAKLGTISDKVERVAKLARWLCEEDIVNGDPDLAEQAAHLCKADLVTEMVGEFADLQGIMGGYYAAKEGLPTEVSEAIRDHYKPAGQGDDVPTAPVTVAVSLADKLDTLVGFFAIDERPTGSKDPFALRRAALGIMSLLFSGTLRLEMSQAIQKIGEMLLQQSSDKNTMQSSMEKGLSELPGFLAERLKVQQKEAGVRHDLIDAVFVLGGEDDLVRLLARVHALQAFVETEDGTNLLAGYKRATNILKKEKDVSSDTNPSPEPAEAALTAALDKVEPAADQAIAEEHFEDAMTALASLRAPIDEFFNDVTVHDEDAEKRNARLSLLERVRDAVHKVADFSKIEG